MANAMKKKGLQTYQDFQAAELDQGKLIMMMFGGAVSFLDRALKCCPEDPGEADRLIARAKKVIIELIASLNIEASGDMGELLLKTYRDIFRRLNYACLADDMDEVRRVRDALAGLGDSWGKVFSSEEYLRFKKTRTVAASR